MGIETDKEVQENIVAGLKKLRKERGLSQRVFLYDTGIHIGRIETGASPITITSKQAYYNKKNHETNFFKDVKLNYLVHEATSQNLDLSFQNNLASMYNNVIYKKPGTKLTADRLNIDLVTKNSKIFMDNKSEKIKIIEKI